MFWRFTAVVVSVAMSGAWLLALRHNRVQAQSELTQAQLRINRQDERLWLLRANIAQRVTPLEIERLCADLGPLHPILPYAPGPADALALSQPAGQPIALAPGSSGQTPPTPGAPGISGLRPDAKAPPSRTRQDKSSSKQAAAKESAPQTPSSQKTSGKRSSGKRTPSKSPAPKAPPRTKPVPARVATTPNPRG